MAAIFITRDHKQGDKNDNTEKLTRNIKFLMFILCACVVAYHIANRKQPDDNDPDGSSLNPANAARQLGLLDEAETANNEQREECGYALLNPRTMMVIPMFFFEILLFITAVKELWTYLKIKTQCSRRRRPLSLSLLLSLLRASPYLIAEILFFLLHQFPFFLFFLLSFALPLFFFSQILLLFLLVPYLLLLVQSPSSFSSSPPSSLHLTLLLRLIFLLHLFPTPPLTLPPHHHPL